MKPSLKQMGQQHTQRIRYTTTPHKPRACHLPQSALTDHDKPPAFSSLVKPRTLNQEHSSTGHMHSAMKNSPATRPPVKAGGPEGNSCNGRHISSHTSASQSRGPRGKVIQRLTDLQPHVHQPKQGAQSKCHTLVNTSPATRPPAKAGGPEGMSTQQNTSTPSSRHLHWPEKHARFSNPATRPTNHHGRGPE
jgi:hypothetical protein